MKDTLRIYGADFGSQAKNLAKEKHDQLDEQAASYKRGLEIIDFDTRMYVIEAVDNKFVSALDCELLQFANQKYYGQFNGNEFIYFLKQEEVVINKEIFTRINFILAEQNTDLIEAEKYHVTLQVKGKIGSLLHGGADFTDLDNFLAMPHTIFVRNQPPLASNANEEAYMVTQNEQRLYKPISNTQSELDQEHEEFLKNAHIISKNLDLIESHKLVEFWEKLENSGLCALGSVGTSQVTT